MDNKKQHFKTAAIFTATYLTTILAIAIYNNTLFLWEFCGSLSDFQDGPVPEVCLSLTEYTLQSIQHTNHTILALTTATITTLIYHFREKTLSQIQKLKPIKTS